MSVAPNKESENGQKNIEAINVDSEDDEEDPIDDEQLEEYQDMIEQLGNFPVRI